MNLDPTTTQAIEAVLRVESARLIGGLVRLVRDVGLAEDVAQEAFLAALDTWPRTGLPERPGAWLMAAARNRAVDHLRRRRHVDAKSLALDGTFDVAEAVPAIEPPEPDEVADDVLRLVLAACHPVLSREARVALTLRLVGGLATDEIGRAFLVPEATIAQRIVRAKRSLAEARVTFDVPVGDALVERLPAVLEVVYLVFNEGHTATSGPHMVRPPLCDEALRLARILAAALPEQAEVHGLLALLELTAARLRSRVAANGEPVLLLDQDRSRWDRLLITRGLAALDRAAALARPLGAYTLQAAIAACHARAARAELTDWPRIVALYDALVEVTGSPVVELNRAVAVCHAFGPAEALELVDELVDEPVLANYHLLDAVRGDLLCRLGRATEARLAFERALSLATNVGERIVLERRVRECGGS